MSPSAPVALSAWGHVHLPSAARHPLLERQAAWGLAEGVAATALAVGGVPSPWNLAVATACGVVAARPVRVPFLPLLLVLVVAASLVLGWLGLPSGMAVGAAAGLAVGSGPALVRVEAVLAGVAGGAAGAWLLGLGPFGAPGTALVVGVIAGLASAQALLPGALRFEPTRGIPGPGRIAATLTPAHRPPAMRAWQLDQELRRGTRDAELRAGFGEVAGWVYRLALSAQALDADLLRIVPEEVTRRKEGLAPSDDAFVRERRVATAAHLDRLLAHRDTLERELGRTRALQEYALAWLEEARGGLAVAAALPGESTPERLDEVLEKLRGYARHRDAERQAGREVR